MKDIRNDVVKILKKYTFNKDVWNNFSDDTNIIKDLRINSARIVDIILDIEELYDIEIPDSELERLIKFSDIITMIEEKSKQN